jgi:thiamine-monophosphate kinase
MSWREADLLPALLAVLQGPDGLDAGNGVVLGPGDDAAVWQPSGAVVATVDSVVAGCDWLPEWTPHEAIGHRALAVNLSDLAAMGAKPRVVLLALELPPDADPADVLASARGLRRLADRHNVSIVGGDLGCSPGPARWTVTALGEQGGALLRRTTAQPGDRVWLVGPQQGLAVGAAAAGLAMLKHGFANEPAAQPVLAAHLWPEPQVAAGQWLSGLGRRVAVLASGVSLALDLPRPPWLTPWLQTVADNLGLDWRQWVAAGGDDYALLVAAPPDLDLSPLGATHIGWAGLGVGVTLAVAGQPTVLGGHLHGAATAKLQ